MGIEDLLNALTDSIQLVFELPILTVVGRRRNVAVKLLPFVQREGGGGALFAYGNQAQAVCEVVRGESLVGDQFAFASAQPKGNLVVRSWMRFARRCADTNLAALERPVPSMISSVF